MRAARNECGLFTGHILVLIVRLVFRYNQKSFILFALGWGTYYLVTIVNILFLLKVVPAHPAIVFGPALMAPVEVILFLSGGSMSATGPFLQKRNASQRRTSRCSRDWNRFGAARGAPRKFCLWSSN